MPTQQGVTVSMGSEGATVKSGLNTVTVDFVDSRLIKVTAHDGQRSKTQYFDMKEWKWGPHPKARPEE